MTTFGASDPRGVLRGRCTSCTCPQYICPTQGDIKCFGCGHPPGKHFKLDPVSSPVGHGSYHSGAQSGSGTYAGVASHPNPNLYSYQQPQPMSGPSAYSGGSQQYSAYSSPSIDLPRCPAPGCYKKVHYDPELGPFDYCSPDCRNRDLLPRERERLEKDIADFSKKISSLPPLDNPTSSAAAHSTSGASKPGKPLIVKVLKKPKEEMGIVTMEEPGEGGLCILGVELDSPAYKALKDGDIKLFDVITELNKEWVTKGVLFRQSTRDKTRLELTLKRNHNTPSIKSLLSKVKDKCPSATHIRVLKNPCQIVGAKDFGFVPVMVIDQHQESQCKLGVCESSYSSAHLSGVTIDDVVLMYALMNNSKIGEGKILAFKSKFEEDIRTALTEGKSLILVLKRQYI